MAKSKQTVAERDNKRDKLIAFGQRVKQAREKLGLSQNDLAVKISVTPGAVAQWELGKNFVQKRTFDKLVKILKVSDEWLAGDAVNLAEVTILDVFRRIHPHSQPLAIAMLEQIEQNQSLMPMMQAAPAPAASPVSPDSERNPTTAVGKSKASSKKTGKGIPLRQHINKHQTQAIA